MPEGGPRSSEKYRTPLHGGAKTEIHGPGRLRLLSRYAAAPPPARSTSTSGTTQAGSAAGSSTSAASPVPTPGPDDSEPSTVAATSVDCVVGPEGDADALSVGLSVVVAEAEPVSSGVVEGAAVAAEADPVGDVPDWLVGGLEGLPDGFDDGLLDGFAVGLPDGFDDGPDDGLVVGVADEGGAAACGAGLSPGALLPPVCQANPT